MFCRNSANFSAIKNFGSVRCTGLTIPSARIINRKEGEYLQFREPEGPNASLLNEQCVASKSAGVDNNDRAMRGSTSELMLREKHEEFLKPRFRLNI